MYTFIVSTFLIRIINLEEDNISVMIQDFFNAFSIIITSSVTLYYLFIIKIITIIKNSKLSPFEFIKKKFIELFKGKKENNKSKEEYYKTVIKDSKNILYQAKNQSDFQINL